MGRHPIGGPGFSNEKAHKKKEGGGGGGLNRPMQSSRSLNITLIVFFFFLFRNHGKIREKCMYKKNSSDQERAASVQGRMYRQVKREIDVPNVTFNVARSWKALILENLQPFPVREISTLLSQGGKQQT